MHVEVNDVKSTVATQYVRPLSRAVVAFLAGGDHLHGWRAITNPTGGLAATRNISGGGGCSVYH